MDWSFGYKAMMVTIIAVPILALGGAAAYVVFGGDDTKDANYIAGRELQQQGRLEEALAEYDEAIRLTPGSLKAFAGRGDTFYALGDLEQAWRDYDQAIGLRSSLALLLGHPDYASHSQAIAQAYVGLALVHTERGHDMEAQRKLAEAVMLGVDPTQAREAIEGLKAHRCRSQTKQLGSSC